jgi:tRNA(fMet)-specific endonuclease VapC
VRFLLDTNVVSHAIRGDARVRRRIGRHAQHGIAVSAVTVAELTYGSLKHPQPERHRLAWQAFVALCEVLPFDEEAAREHARVRYALRSSPIGERDLFIAAIALPRKLVVVTHNVREFRRVPGLRVEDWSVG